jgi:hypothetical protein
MSLCRRLLAALCCAVLMFCLAFPVRSAEEPSARELVQQMLNYYRHHQTAAKTDIYALLQQLETVDPEEAAFWRTVFAYWFYAVTDMPKNNTDFPADLPDEQLCIVVLGYRLQPSGAMEPELKGRLELALRAAEAYPEAMVLCTGGGTATDAPGVTEAHQMVRWLKDNGLDPDRIITESKSYHTIQNAQLTFEILSRDHPHITDIILVTSDYHLPRSSTLFYTQSLLTARETGTEPIRLSCFLGYEAGHEGFAEDPLDQTAHVARLCGFEYEYAEPPVLSVLTQLQLHCPHELPLGEDPDLTVTAVYDSGFSRDVTADALISGYDPMDEAEQEVTVSYGENGVSLTSQVKIRRPEPETVPPTVPPTVPATDAPEASDAASQSGNFSPRILILPAILLLVLIFYLRRQ